MATNVGPRSYEDFVPSSEWITGDSSDTLTIELPGFRKEHLRVQLDNYGNLRTSGERPIGGNQWRRFRKEFRVPDNCNASDIRAKFENGILTITLPKLITEAEPVPVAPPPSAKAPEPQVIPEPSKPEVLKEPEPAKTENEKGVTEKIEEKPQKVEDEVVKEEKGKYGRGGLVLEMKKNKRWQLLICAAVAAVLLVGLGIYVAHHQFKNVAENGIGELLEFDEL